MSPDEAEAALARSLARLKEVACHKMASSVAPDTAAVNEAPEPWITTRIRVWFGPKRSGQSLTDTSVPTERRPADS